MTTRPFLQHAHSWQAYTQRHTVRRVIGILGTPSGVVDVPGWNGTRVYVRLHGDRNQTVRAVAAASFDHTATLPVEVEEVKRYAGSLFQVLGPALQLPYTSNAYFGAVGVHGDEHERRDFGAGGKDPVNVHTRMYVQLRARPQATPDLTLHVEAGFYRLDGTFREYAGGDSAAFTLPTAAPTGTPRRCDLLYLGSDLVLHIVSGSETTDGSAPAYPTTPANCLPICYVYLDALMSAITDEYIKDARVLLTDSGELNGALALGGILSPAELTAQTDDYNPTGLSSVSVLRLSTDTARDLTGLQGGSAGRVIVVHNVGNQDLTLKDESASSSAANRFALSADLTLAGDDAAMLQYDGTSNRWRCVGKSSGGGASGAPTTSKYITTAADATLSNEVVIPGLAAGFDIAGTAGGAGTDKEYDSGAHGLTFVSGGAPAVIDVNTTLLSHLYVKTTDTSDRYGYEAWTPGAGAFDVLCKMGVAGESGTQNMAVVLIVADALNANRAAVQLLVGNGAITISAYTYASSSWTQRGVTWNAVGVGECHARISRDGANNISLWFSVNGKRWQLVATQNFSVTVTQRGWRFYSAGAFVTEYFVDYLRSTT